MRLARHGGAGKAVRLIPSPVGTGQFTRRFRISLKSFKITRWRDHPITRL